MTRIVQQMLDIRRDFAIAATPDQKVAFNSECNHFNEQLLDLSIRKSNSFHSKFE